jgi:hypothetical protein
MPAALSLAGLLLFAAASAGASTVTCESTGNAYKACPVNTSNGVRLSRQLSSQGCWEHDTWGYDADKIWVTNGCRAEFQVGSQKSSDNSNAIAAAAVVGLAAAAVVASNQHDDHHDKHHNGNYNYNDNYNNNYNYNYGRNYDDRYPDDYRGRNYNQSRYGYNGYRGDPIRTFSCESNGNRTSYCDIPTRGHVEIFRQRSSSPCTYGRSWGVNGRRVWVEDGCRAEFAVY